MAHILTSSGLLHGEAGTGVFDIFQKGLKRGSMQLPYAPGKRYFYVEHPEEGWRVYLRAACFVHEQYKPFNPYRFIIVKRTGGDPEKASWEPPKGQMEAKDARGPHRSIMQLLKDNVRREVEEEAKIGNLRDLSHTALILQSVEPDFPPNTYFQYHIFSAYAHSKQILGAFEQFDRLEKHPEEFKALRSDQREKDAIAWYTPGKKMMGKWSPTLLKMYLDLFTRGAPVH
jgi:ADP-ribose pyrophosphatase YjhB (NUDIX family)